MPEKRANGHVHIQLKLSDNSSFETAAECIRLFSNLANIARARFIILTNALVLYDSFKTISPRIREDRGSLLQNKLVWKNSKN